MVIYLYRWRIDPKKEGQFQKAWAYVTEQFREKSGSLGSRLHRGDDGLWYGYAQWPSRETREKSNLQHAEFVEARRLMKEAVTETFPEITLDPLMDYLVNPGRISIGQTNC